MDNSPSHVSFHLPLFFVFEPKTPNVTNLKPKLVKSLNRKYRLSTLDFQKKGFLKRFQFLKKRFYHEKKRFFLHRQFQILELKIGFALKKKKVFFIANFLHFFRLVRTSHN